ncbi:hypothetical protein BU15DRAFT_72893 [Melanogaster broomeanus]|nr:hypothetical protein BU15DRAFT_72893 [Melanogaster broomeanus]
MPSNVYLPENNTERTAPTLSPSPVITPPKSSSRGPLADLTGWSSYSDMRILAPGGSGGVQESDSFSSGTPSGMGRGPEYMVDTRTLSPGNMSSYLLTDSRPPGFSAQISQSSPESSALPTEFQSYASPSPPPPFRQHHILTPEASPLVARARGNGSHFLSQSAQINGQDGIPTTPSKRKSSRSQESTPPRTSIRQTPTHPATHPLQPTAQDTPSSNINIKTSS